MGYGMGISKILTTAVLTLATVPVAAQDRGVANSSVMTYDTDIMRQLPPPANFQPGLRDDGRKFPTLWVGSVRWDQSEKTIEYNVDHSLSVSAVYYYNFQIFPELHLGQGKPRGLDSGYYLMRMVVLRPLASAEEASIEKELGSLRPDYVLYRRFVTSTEQLVEVNRGSIRAEVKLEFPAISAVSMRNTLLIQFLPIKEKALRFNADGKLSRDSEIVIEPNPSYIANVIKMPFVPRNGSGFATPPPKLFSDEVRLEDSLDLGSFIRLSTAYSKALQQKLQKPVSPRTLGDRMGLTYYLSTSPHLALQMVSPPNRKGMSAEQLMAKLQSLDPSETLIPEEYAEPLCRLLTSELGVDPRLLGIGESNRRRNQSSFKQLAFGRCLLDPEGAFEIIRTWHVTSLTGAPPKHLRGAPNSLALSFNFGTNRQKAIDTFNNINGGVNLAGFLPADLRGFLNFGWNWAVNLSNSRAKFEGAILSGTTHLDVHEWDLLLELKEYTSCTMILPQMRHEAWVFTEKSTVQDRTHGIYICYPGIERRSLQTVERYYHIQPAPSSASAIDIYNPKNQVVNMVIRSRRDYSFFLKTIRGFMTPTHADGITAGEDLKAQAAAYRTAMPATTGVLSNGIAFAGPKMDELRRSRESSNLLTRFFHRRVENFD